MKNNLRYFYNAVSLWLSCTVKRAMQVYDPVVISGWGGRITWLAEQIYNSSVYFAISSETHLWERVVDRLRGFYEHIALFTYVNVYWLNGVYVDIRGRWRTISLAKLVSVVFIGRSKGLGNRDGFGRRTTWEDWRPGTENRMHYLHFWH